MEVYFEFVLYFLLFLSLCPCVCAIVEFFVFIDVEVVYYERNIHISFSTAHYWVMMCLIKLVFIPFFCIKTFLA